ncbi:MAG: AbrB/MazE/SpoVT family DNA-binding domain-containing protein [Acidilobaceae archaeon]|nr:AbrB/MazE/SpoVT family DNA-binding domain-containing protein [Acidilobaceae archaeon]
MSISIAKRRIQKLGGSSLIVTLPKTWAKRYGLDVGDTVVVLDEGDHIKIFPPDTRNPQFTEIIRVRHNDDTPISLLIDCLYLKGYRRFVISTSHASAENVMKIIDEAKGHPKVKSVSLGFNDIEIALDGVELDNPAKLTRYYNIKIQELLDIIEKAKVSPVSDEAVESIVEDAVSMARTIGRAIRKHGISLCQPDTVEPTAIGELMLVPRMLQKIYAEIRGGAEVPEDVMKKLKLTMLELFGGIAGRSTKRLATAIKMIGEIDAEIDRMGTNGRSAALAGLMKGLLLVMKNVAENTVCENASMGYL